MRGAGRTEYERRIFPDLRLKLDVLHFRHCFRGNDGSGNAFRLNVRKSFNDPPTCRRLLHTLYTRHYGLKFLCLTIEIAISCPTSFRYAGTMIRCSHSPRFPVSQSNDGEKSRERDTRRLAGLRRTAHSSAQSSVGGGKRLSATSRRGNPATPLCGAEGDFPELSNPLQASAPFVGRTTFGPVERRWHPFFGWRRRSRFEEVRHTAVEPKRCKRLDYTPRIRSSGRSVSNSFIGHPGVV
jgi:hypothetical protein